MYTDLFSLIYNDFNKGVDTFSEQQYTLPFYEFLDETNPFIYPEQGEFKSLFPENYNGVIKEAIKQEFYYRQVGQYVPQKFLRRFHRLLNERRDAWEKLLESETLIKPEYATSNYDMTEERTQHAESQNNGSVTNKSTATTANSGTSGDTSWMSDTPDGSISDIETYMSSANKNQSTSEASGNSATEGSSSNTGSSNGDVTENVRRFGNIGVTTFEKILEGYRNSAAWCSFEEVIFPEVNKLFFALM